MIGLTCNAHVMYISCMKTIKLTATDRDFFAMVARAVFTNPFSETRMELDRRIAGAPAAASWDELVEQVVAKVGDKLTGLAAERKASLRYYAGEDQELLRTVF